MAAKSNDNFEFKPVDAVMFLVFWPTGAEARVSNLERALAVRKCFQLVQSFLQLVTGT